MDQAGVAQELHEPCDAVQNLSMGDGGAARVDDRLLPFRVPFGVRPAGRARPCLLEPAFLQGSFLVVWLHGVAKPGKEQGGPEGEGHALRRLVPDLLPLLGDGVKVARERAVNPVVLVSR